MSDIADYKLSLIQCHFRTYSLQGRGADVVAKTQVFGINRIPKCPSIPINRFSCKLGIVFRFERARFNRFERARAKRFERADHVRILACIVCSV